MNKFILVLILFLLVYTAGHFLIYLLYSKIFKLKPIRIAFLFVLYFFAFMFIFARILENYIPLSFIVFFDTVGSFWFAVVSYLFLFTVLYYLLYLLHILHYKIFNKETALLRIREYYIVATSVFLIIIIFIGYYNAVNPRIERLSLKTEKNINGDSLRIAMVSDIHAGYLMGPERISRLIDILNDEKIDILFIPGDLIDHGLKIVTEKDSFSPFKNLKTKYGIYAVMGNHDHFDEADGAERYFEDNGIKILRDESVIIDGIQIIGREDLSAFRRSSGNKKRKELASFEKNEDAYIVILDHQPYALEQAANYGSDLQLSGHTHNGQYWPFSIVTNMIYEKSWGNLRKLNTDYYISCGFGTWGPVFRLGSYSEIVIIDVIKK